MESNLIAWSPAIPCGGLGRQRIGQEAQILLAREGLTDFFFPSDFISFRSMLIDNIFFQKNRVSDPNNLKAADVPSF